MHYLFGRIDLYALDVQGGDLGVRDASGTLLAGTSAVPFLTWDVVRYVSRENDLMAGIGTCIELSDYMVEGLNRAWPPGERTPDGELLWEQAGEVPADPRLKVVDESGQPTPGIEVAVYQAIGGDGSSGAYSQWFDNRPDITGVTDAEGAVKLGSQPFGNLSQTGIAGGVALLKLRDPSSGRTSYHWLELVDFHRAFWRGTTGTYVHTVVLPSGPIRVRARPASFETAAGQRPDPKTIEIDTPGVGVARWRVADPSQPWLRTNPSADIGQAYATGPLTLIADARALAPGTYEADVVLTPVIHVAGSSGADSSPIAVHVTMNVGGGTVPGAPAGAWVTATGATGATVAWTAPVTDGGSPILGYAVSSNPAGASCSTDGARTCAISGLTPGVQYAFSVRASNSVGTGAASALTAPVRMTPPVTSMAPLPTWTASTGIALSWSTAPAPGAVPAFDVRYRRAPWKGGFGSWVTWKASTGGTAATFGASAGSTYCFSARARYAGGQSGAWTPETCTGVPLDDRALSRTTAWSAWTGSGYYRGSALVTRTQGAKLTRTGVVARRLAIVATTCPTCGSVRVYWNGSLVRTISLRSATTVNRKVLPVATFGSARSGTVRIIVRSSGARVLIDGLAVRRN
jgi:hypothetical protein